MGFWHTGYIDHVSYDYQGGFMPLEPKLQIFTCEICGLEFSSDADLHIHIFEGHNVNRPALIFKGRECGQSRIRITKRPTPSNWSISNTRRIFINETEIPVNEAPEILSSEINNQVLDVRLCSEGIVQEYQFEFSIAEEEDLRHVDEALARFIYRRTLSLQAIEEFIQQAKEFKSARHYLSGIADYLYGVLAREREDLANKDYRECLDYQSKYDQAVNKLGMFDRQPAEAICGLVAFHYNHFDIAMKKTHSMRVSTISMRFIELLANFQVQKTLQNTSRDFSYDLALSDKVIEGILEWCSIPLDGSAGETAIVIEDEIDKQRESDKFKLHIILSEHYLAAGNIRAARIHADVIRDGIAEKWYEGFRNRLQGVGQNG